LKHAQLITLETNPVYKKAFQVCIKILDKKLNNSESTKSIQIEKEKLNPIALTIDSVDTHNSTTVIELKTSLEDIDPGIVDFNNMKSTLVMNQIDFEDNDAELLKNIIDSIQDIDGNG